MSIRYMAAQNRRFFEEPAHLEPGYRISTYDTGDLNKNGVSPKKIGGFRQSKGSFVMRRLRRVRQPGFWGYFILAAIWMLECLATKRNGEPPMPLIFQTPRTGECLQFQNGADNPSAPGRPSLK